MAPLSRYIPLLQNLLRVQIVGLFYFRNLVLPEPKTHCPKPHNISFGTQVWHHHPDISLYLNLYRWSVISISHFLSSNPLHTHQHQLLRCCLASRKAQLLRWLPVRLSVMLLFSPPARAAESEEYWSVSPGQHGQFFSNYGPGRSLFSRCK